MATHYTYEELSDKIRRDGGIWAALEYIDARDVPPTLRASWTDLQRSFDHALVVWEDQVRPHLPGVE